MQIYSVVNVENLKLYEPPMIMDERENVQVPSIDDFSPEYLDELKEDIIMDSRTRTSCRAISIIFKWALREHIQANYDGSRRRR